MWQDDHSLHRAQERILAEVQPRCSVDLDMLEVSVPWDAHQGQGSCGRTYKTSCVMDGSGSRTDLVLWRPGVQE